MKASTITCCFALLLVISACNDTTTDSEAAKSDTSTASVDKPSGPVGPPQVDSATAMKNWQDYATPGDMHKMMASWDGTWNCEMNSWMQEGTPPMTSKGKAVSKMIFNGLYQSSKFSGDMMGAPFEGMGTTGYDKHKKVFVTSWIDNMGSGIMKMEGPWDAANKTMTLTGKMIDPASGTECDIKQVIKIVDDNTQIMEMYGYTPQGKEWKSLEIKYTRAK